MRIRNKSICTIAYMLIIMLLLSACGEVREVPQLVEPLSDNQSFRPVERRTVGKLSIEVGHVVPMEYCHFYDRATTIKDIYCNLGQYVNEGDVLAVADVEILQEQLTDMEAAYNLLVNKHAAQAPIHELNMKILASKKQACLYGYDEEGAAQFNVEIKKEEENHTYDEELYNYMVEYYQNEIGEIKKDLADSTIRAKKSGYVTYVKDTSKGSVVNIHEAVVIIADYNEAHIEVDGVTLANNPYKKYEIKYAIINGEEVPIEEYEYTSKESVLAKAQESYPNIRYKTVEPSDLKVGESVVLGFVSKEKRNVLTVGYDSTNRDEGGNYVYVKGEDDSLEKRYVELGTGDDYYVEVTSGLEEGEEVYYIQEAAKPIYYEPYTVSRSDFAQSIDGKNLKKAEVINTAYFATCSGKVESILVDSGTEVKKGDTLMIIDSGGGSANIQEIETEIKHLTMDYEKAVKDYDKQIKDLRVQSLRLLTTIEEGQYYNTLGEHDEDIINCQRDVLEHQADILEAEKEVLRLDYEENLRKLKARETKLKKNNNGSGKISIVAQDDGVVSKVYVIEGNLVEVGGENHLLLSCTKRSDDMASIVLNRDATQPGLNAKVTIRDDENEINYTASVLGCTPEGKSYAFTEGEKVYVSTCIKGAVGSETFIAKLDDTDFFDKVQLKDCKVSIEVLNLPSMIVLQGSLVYSEESKSKAAKKYYVWKVQNGQLVKQYIIKGTEFGIGNDNAVVVISGVSEGDVLAKETNANSSNN